jgi:hypothetical protein
VGFEPAAFELALQLAAGKCNSLIISDKSLFHAAHHRDQAAIDALKSGW